MLWTWIAIVFSVGITSTLSGILGMGGGMLLMGALTLLLPTGPAMILHGIAQLAANGSRAILHRRFIQWNIMPRYALGALVAFGLFRGLAFLPESWMIYLLMGCLPWFAVYGKKLMVLDIEKRSHAVFCGFLVTVLQLACGVSGPALDIFYLHTKMSRHSIVASKALTQALGHALKLLYYGSLVESGELPASMKITVCVVALLGTFIGGRFLEKANDQSFQLWSRRVILVIGTVYLVQGAYGWLH